jgi:hypothetical protein
MPHKGSSLERRWLVAVPLDHPLAAMERLTPRDIVREDLMIFARSMNPPLWDQVIASFCKQGAETNFLYDTIQPQIGLTMAEEDAGLIEQAGLPANRFAEQVLRRLEPRRHRRGNPIGLQHRRDRMEGHDGSTIGILSYQHTQGRSRALAGDASMIIVPPSAFP